jgi:hypothetical protein
MKNSKISSLLQEGGDIQKQIDELQQKLFENNLKIRNEYKVSDKESTFKKEQPELYKMMHKRPEFKDILASYKPKIEEKKSKTKNLDEVTNKSWKINKGKHDIKDDFEDIPKAVKKVSHLQPLVKYEDLELAELPHDAGIFDDYLNMNDNFKNGGVATKTWLDMTHTMFETKEINLDEGTLNLISDMIMDKYNMLIKKLISAGKTVRDAKLNVLFKSTEDETHSSIVIQNDDINKKDIMRLLLTRSKKNYNTPTYMIQLSKFIFTITPNSNKQSKGGCNDASKDKSLTHKFSYLHEVKLIDPKSKNNNCGIVCILKFLGIKGNTMKPDHVRTLCQLPKDQPLTPIEIKRIAKHFDIGITISDEKMQIIISRDLMNKKVCNLILKSGHYMLLGEETRYKICENKNCNRVLLESNTDHVCNAKRETYKNNMINGQNDYIPIKPIKEANKIDYDSMIFFDLETFPLGKTRSHEPYACGYYHEKYYVDYGEGCMTNFVDYIIKQKNTIVSAYNGSGFDYYFLLNKLIEKKVVVSNMILMNGKLLGFKYGENNKVFDLFLFVTSSLDSACKAYNIENAKSKFDHNRIKSWDNVEECKNEVLPYLKLDVMGMRELFIKFNDMIYEKFEVNITNYVTISHLGYALWTSNLEHTIEVSKDLEKYDFVNASTYGARCYPQQKRFTSEYATDVESGKMKYEEFKSKNDYIFNADATSLYPASMSSKITVFPKERCHAQYPTGKSRWSNEPEKEFNKGTIGIYEINFKCNRTLMIPILPRKDDDGGLSWSLEGGHGKYTNVDIQNAIRHGYEIEFINKCLVWDKSGHVFDKYVSNFYKLKAEAEAEKNPILRGIAKLFLNSLYGKTLQKAIVSQTQIVNSIDEFLNFSNEYNLTDYRVLNSTRIICSGQTKDKSACIKKPCQLGSFVLAYSRSIMLHYMEAVDPTLETVVFTYTDTDSLHLTSFAHKKLLDLGYIKEKKNAQLGYLTSDIDNEGVIFREINLAPKSYFYEYITNKNEIHNKDLATMKLKGIPKKDMGTGEKLIKPEYYDAETPKTVSFTSLRKKGMRLTSVDDKKGISNFSIISLDNTRTMFKTVWCKFNLIENIYYPKGYSGEDRDDDFGIDIDQLIKNSKNSKRSQETDYEIFE